MNEEEATVNPDGSTSFGGEQPPTPVFPDTAAQQEAGGDDFDAGENAGGTPDEGFLPPFEEELKSGIDPAFYLLFGFLIVVLLYYIFFLRKRNEEAEDDFFSNIEGDKFNLNLPGEVDEYYKIKAKCEAAGWEPGKGPSTGAEAANGPHRVLAQALMKRAIADIPLVQFMQKEAQGMGKLYARSMCSIKQWRSYQKAESMVSTEVEEVRAEADEIEPGWSDVIWRQAMQYHTMLKKKHEMEAQAAQEKSKMLEKNKTASAAGGTVGGSSPNSGNSSGNVPLDAKAKEIAAQKAAEELIKEEEKERQKQAKKAFSGGVKKGFLDNNKSGKKK